MINSVHLENFRALEDTGNIPIKKLTILLGKNSIGKSSFLRSFPLFQQSLLNTRTEPLLWYTPDLVDFGSFDDTKRDGTPDLTPIKFSFNLDADIRNSIRNHLPFLWTFRHRKGFPHENPSTFSKTDQINTLIDDVNEIMKEFEFEIPINFELNLYKHHAEYVIAVFGSKIVIHHEYKDKNSKKNQINIDGTEYHGVSITEIKNSQIIPDVNFTAINSETEFVDSSSSGRAAQSIISMLKNSPTSDGLDASRKFDFLDNSVLQLMLKKPDFKLFTEKLSKLGETFSDEDKKDINWTRVNPRLRKLREESIAQKILSDSIEFETLYRLLLLSNLNNLVDVINSEFHKFYSNMSYSTPVRANAERSYRNQSLSVNQVNPDGENVPTILRNLQENKLNKFNEWQRWTEKNLNLVFQVVNENNFSSISVKSTNEKNFHNLADTGFGYSQMLPIILNIWLSTQNSPHKRISYDRKQVISLVEQPELHLHPAMQASLMHTLDIVLSKERYMNMIIETHSEYMIKQLGVDIARKIVDPGDVQILIFDESNGKSVIRTSKFTKNGTLENWPLGFFRPDYYYESEFE